MTILLVGLICFGVGLLTGIYLAGDTDDLPPNDERYRR